MGTPRVLIYQDQAGQWRWNRQADNGRITADSGEGYILHRDCRKAALEANAQPYKLVDAGLPDGKEPVDEPPAS